MATPTKPNSRLGTYVLKTFKDESFQAYVPPPLPPHPPLALQRLLPLLEQANQALGRLDGLASILPDPSLFIYLYVRKEAVLSSQIEGTQSSFSDLMLFESAEAPSVPLEDVQEVSNYVAAMNHGLRRLREDFPLSLRLIREIHKILLSKGRGSQKRPGEFRETQNWIGGTRPGNAAFVPPPPEKLMECMAALEKFLHRDHEDLPILVKTALVHVQFETIHPFLDGNGRLGRLLITFLLCVAGSIHEPILYLSLYFKTNRQKYYELLDRVRTHGDWETVHHIRCALSKVLATAEEWGYISDNPVRKTRLSRRDCTPERPVVTPEQVKRLVTVLSEPAKSIALLLAMTGLRIGELLALRWKNVNLNDRLLRVTETVYEGHFDKPKTKRSVRAIPLGQEAVSTLFALGQDVSDPEQLVFATHSGRPLCRRNLLQRQLRPTCKILGLPTITWHALRHCHATLLDAVGAPLGTVQALLGHASPEVTRQIYLHAIPEEQRRAVEKVEKLLIGPKWTQLSEVEQRPN